VNGALPLTRPDRGHPAVWHPELRIDWRRGAQRPRSKSSARRRARAPAGTHRSDESRAVTQRDWCRWTRGDAQRRRCGARRSNGPMLRREVLVPDHDVGVASGGGSGNAGCSGGRTGCADHGARAFGSARDLDVYPGFTNSTLSPAQRVSAHTIGWLCPGSARAASRFGCRPRVRRHLPPGTCRPASWRAPQSVEENMHQRE